MSPQIFPRDLVFDIYLLRSKEIIKSRPARAGSRARDPARGGEAPPSPLNLLDLLDLVELADLLDLLDLLDPKQSTSGAGQAPGDTGPGAGQRQTGAIRRRVA